MTDVKTIFLSALEIGDAEQRAAYLAEACGDNAEVRRQVDLLLKAHERAGGFLKPIAFDPNAEPDQSPVTEGPGTVIGRYKLLEKIGEGGMAVVYMAESATGGPIRRKVALKIIKLGMDTRQVIARFEAERQALALMDHPSIAKVLDAGATETGRPYFVMELVQGVSITEYCDNNRLSTRQRLELFIQVCNAVQHAHQKGIIHRDLKPSNIMVTLHDGKPVPKVIDFGIAKATNQKLTEKTLFTRYAHLIGTPAYMSPEQAELSDLDIDTRSDIYSLGVLLYELLTGTTPFSEEELRKAGYVEMQRVIREQEPVKPSTRVARASRPCSPWRGHLALVLRGEGILPLFSVARASRPCSPWRGHLALVLHVAGRMPARRKGGTPSPRPVPLMGGTPMLREVRGDLDWIVMKSLEKDRARRYETASGLAEDLRRHLEHEPVLARGPSSTYRLGKFLRRHRSQVLAGLLLGVLAVVAGVTLSLWSRNRLQLVEAEGFKDRAILSQAREQYAKADRDAALETIKPILDSEHVGPDARLLQATILVDNRQSDEAVTVLNGLLDDRPEIAGATHALLARILWESVALDAEKLQEIEEHRQKAEAVLPETAEAYFLRAMTAMTVKEQLAALDKALQLDPGHYESRRLRAFTYYASRKYEKLKDDALVMAVIRPRDPLGYSLRAVAWRESGRYPEAIADYDIALALTPSRDPQQVDLSVQRCETLLRVRDYARVIANAQECFKLWPDKPVFQYQTFCALTALGEYDTAAALFHQIIAPGHKARQKFRDWCAKYVFDTLEAQRPWRPVDHEPTGAAFLPMIEAEETHRRLSTKARRVVTDGFTARYSPDGKKIAFSAGFWGYSGLARYDVQTGQTDLLIVPGKDPAWSPDGRYLAFVRDCAILPVTELAEAERVNRHRPVADEEVWLMNSDGTQPRRLAVGGLPSWSSDAKHIYYQSPRDNTLYKLTIEGSTANPQKLLSCSDRLPEISPDEKYVAYLVGGSLLVVELASQKIVAKPVLPFMVSGAIWSLDSRELCLGGMQSADIPLGLWTYNLAEGQARYVLEGPVHAISLGADGTKLLLNVPAPYYEIWAADLDPNVSLVEALGPTQPLNEHYRRMVASYTRRIEADPLDAYAYSDRAHYYDYLHNRVQANADMRRWSAAVSGHLPCDYGHVINLPFDCELVFSAERPVNTIPMMSVAFGQKGRCDMKLCQIPMFIASLFGLCVFSGLDEPVVHADLAFGTPVNLKTVIPVLDGGYEGVNCLSSDGLEMYVESQSIRPGGFFNGDLYVLRRTSTNQNWDPPESLGPAINSAYVEVNACISRDGLRLYFMSDRPGGYGQWDIYMTTRAAKDEPWGQAVNMGPKVNSSVNDHGPWESPNGLELYFTSGRGGYGYGDIYVARRAAENDPWGDPVNLGPVVNSPYGDSYLSLSPDGLFLFFGDRATGPHRPGGHGNGDLWMAKRASLSDPWQTPVNLGPGINSPAYETYPRVSPDGCTLYFSTYSDGVWENWQAPIVPIVDFNGDGKVDAADMAILADNWGQNEPLCDIAPFAWGDGVVDEKDLAVLMELLMTPAQHAADVPCDVVLSWTSPEFVDSHDVYFGTSFDDVSNATRDDPCGVLVSEGQTETTYDPEGLLEFSQTYYWRIDTVQVVLGSLDPVIDRGPVLSFTTEAYAHPIQNIIATASSFQPGMGPQNTVNGSGLDKNDGHSTNGTDMWQSTTVPPHWIEFEFDQVYALHELWVWNSNQLIEPFMGFGAKSVKIEYSTDDTTWTPLEGVPEFAQAPGMPGYTANTIVNFGGVSAQYVKLTIEKGWGVTPSVGLSEVRFFYIPIASATKP